jgi:hypothetical protein
MECAELFKKQPFQEKEHDQILFDNLLITSKIKEIFNLN